MPITIDFKYNEEKNVLLAQCHGDFTIKEDAEYLYNQMKTNLEQVGKPCWVISDVSDMHSKSVKTTIHYSKLTNELRKLKLGTVSVAKSHLQRSGMKLVGTFRAERIHLANSIEEAYKKIEELKNG